MWCCLTLHWCACVMLHMAWPGQWFKEHWVATRALGGDCEVSRGSQQPIATPPEDSSVSPSRLWHGYSRVMVPACIRWYLPDLFVVHV